LNKFHHYFFETASSKNGSLPSIIVNIFSLLIFVGIFGGWEKEAIKTSMKKNKYQRI
jgi:ABC-type phosphate transport system permease subunit